jgi:hypothetical protein
MPRMRSRDGNRAGTANARDEIPSLLAIGNIG